MYSLPHDFTSLEDVVSAFIHGVEEESEALFYQSDVCALACTESNRRAWGMADEDILRHLGSTVERAINTLRGRLLVGRVFPRIWREAPENAWAKRKFYSHFEVCARIWSKEDPGAAEAWLRYCVEHDLSVSDLKLEIKAAGGAVPDERLVYLFDGAVCTLDYLDDHQMTVYFATPPSLAGAVEPGTEIVLTAVIEQAPEVFPA